DRPRHHRRWFRHRHRHRWVGDAPDGARSSPHPRGADPSKQPGPEHGRNAEGASGAAWIRQGFPAVIIDLALYHDGHREDRVLELAEALDAARGPDAFVWIGLHEPTSEELDAVRAEFQLHELAVEDALHAHQ